ncbi:beta-galactosidase [Streptomyces bingchenggensis BCW-1]|uniref:Beta-galactosidase n=1 Tax=Streptomyces bingchenggensis (strain BCW-1) TaxID=749414 RepID=D7CAI5_STRBB|nr:MULTISPECIES: beta-galactosidase [Streptomyces]ADI06542.1 beta-galactosidase [Streptomyces bingchenggensis BCW-1]
MPELSDVTRGRILYGGDYNPEQWPRSVWREDVRLMREARVTTATVGVFSWARLEPRPGARDFGWLDEVLDLLHEGGIEVCLATPTASPPPWMGARHPETLPRDESGATVWYGARNQFCASSPIYCEYALRITEDLAERYGGHPAVRMWHVGNEYGTHCWCDTTARHFRRWLRTRYGGLDALNEAWGTAFWSQRYDSWEEIIPPRRAQYLVNPTQALDFRRFTSDALLECFTTERDVLADRTPHAPVTTNFMPLFIGQDGWAWAAEEDVVSVDVYPDPKDPHAAAYGAMVQDLTRSQAGGPWVLMEQAAGPVNWRGVNHPKPPGLMRLWSLQAVARGADVVCFFQWRQSRQGSEKFHSGMVPHAGEHSRTFQQVRGLGAELRRLGGVVGRGVPAGAAILHDWHAWWATVQDGRPSARLDYPQVVRAWHRALWEQNLTTDFAHPHADLTDYALVAVPQLYLLTDEALDNLVGYVRGGGTLVCGFFTGVADEDDRVRPGGVDQRLRDLLGIRTVHEWWPLDEGETVTAHGPSWPAGFTATLWSEDLEPSTAETVARIKGGELDGGPAITRNRHGAGTAWYVSTLPEPAALRALPARAADEAGLRPPLPGLPEGVEAVFRGEHLFLLNHGRTPAVVPLPSARTDLLTGRVYDTEVGLDRSAAVVLAPLDSPHPKGAAPCTERLESSS